MTTTGSELAGFIEGVTLSDVPPAVRRRVGLLLTDMAAVCIGGRRAPTSLIAAEHAGVLGRGDEATALLDGRRLGATGAAWANGVLANALDFDDGHRLTKGHPGAVVIPAALAAAQLADADADELLVAIIVGYEVAIRAGIALHARDDSYHASGAWGGLGAAAATARLLGLDAAQTLTALGLAEYHAPIAPIMRCCADPAMTKDACAWGAFVGVSSALLASGGFTSVRSEFALGPVGSLGSRWCIEDLYVKAYPCCRWSHGAIAAALEASAGLPAGAPPAAAVERVRIRTFAAADGLATVMPATTEEAQYNLVWPVACALARGRFGVEEVLGPFDEPAVAALHQRVEVVVDAEFTAAFPARRLTAVELVLADGRVLEAGPLEAPGEPDDPEWEAIVARKHAQLIDGERDLEPTAPGAGLRELGAPELLGLLCDAGAVASGA
jgi:2-methylcitrate dehydratase PrpD